VPERDPEFDTDTEVQSGVEGADPVPSQIRSAALVIVIEAAALVGAAGVLISKTITGHPDDVWRAIFGAGLALAAALALAFGARGLLHLRGGARTPIVVLQLLALPVAFDLAFQAGLVGYGGPILVAALAVLYLLFSPPARAALDRAPD
jgi:hypothetical protein